LLVAAVPLAAAPLAAAPLAAAPLAAVLLAAVLPQVRPPAPLAADGGRRTLAACA